MSKTATPDHDSKIEKHDEKKKTSSPFGGIVLAAVLILLTIILFKFLFFSGEKKTPESNNNSNTSTQIAPVYQDVIDVSYGPNYGDNVYIPNGCTGIFVKITKDYCCKNADGLEVCGFKGQDVTDKLGDTSANNTLQFKSQNGDSGTLKIIVTKKPAKN